MLNIEYIKQLVDIIYIHDATQEQDQQVIKQENSNVCKYVTLIDSKERLGDLQLVDRKMT